MPGLSEASLCVCFAITNKERLPPAWFGRQVATWHRGFVLLSPMPWPLLLRLKELLFFAFLASALPKELAAAMAAIERDCAALNPS
jgi:hypothetical protein